MARSADLDESLDRSRASMDAPWSGLGSASDDTLAGSLDGSEHARVSEGGLSRGEAVGRYVILGRLGAGAMGVVYTAHDPELDRMVALKLLRLRGSAARMVAGHRRLLAEAQALARLSHPNVVVVHDAGEHDGQVFVAMEFVEGRTLAAWLEQGAHPWPEVLDVMTQAGRGLAAAHARDLVHRDLKPDNVMIGSDGRVRVMDFGLARAADGASTEDSAHEVSRPRMQALSLMLTVGEGMVGTPAYASPEQLAGGRGGAAGDQFSFCVTFWEALHGRRPFVADSLPELAAKILGGELAEPPSHSRVPAWLRRIVERGLSVDPARRWPSMDALLAALARGRARARMRRGAAAAGLVVAIAAGAAGWRWEGEQRRIRACEAEGAAIGEVWNERIAADLRTAMIATGVGHAEVTADKLTPWLDAHASAWKDARTESCRRAEVEESWDAEVVDRSRWCLDERRTELEVLVGELRQGDAKVVDDAVLAAARLGRLEPCTDELTLSRLPVPPAEDREAIAEVRGELLRSDALRSMGEYDEGLAAAREALARAEALAWPPLVAGARLRVGTLLRYRGDYAEAEAVLEQAFFEAGRADALDVQADAARDLAFVVGDLLARHAEGLRWARHQELLVMRSPDPTGLREAKQLETMATVREAMGEYETAKALYERVLSLQEQALGPEHVDVGLTIGSLAIVTQDMGDHAQAKLLNERALALTEQALGPDHPQVANYVNNLARDLRSLGHPAEAKRLYERALAIWEVSLGPEHPYVAQVLNNLGNASADLGEFDQSAALHERALVIRERVYGLEHPQVAMSLENLATLELKRSGSSDRVIVRLERVLAIREKALGADHPLVGLTHLNLGATYYDLRRYDPTREHLERALRVWDVAGVAPEHPHRVATIFNLATVSFARGRLPEASRWVEESLRIRESTGSSALDLATTRLLAARVRWEVGEDRAQAIALAEQARAVLREHGSALLAEADEWLASHRLPATGDPSR